MQTRRLTKDEFRISEVAEIIGEQRNTVRAMVRRGAIPSIWRGKQRKVKAAILEKQFPDCWRDYVAGLLNRKETQEDE